MTPTSSELGGVGLLVELRRRGMKVAQEGDRLRVTPKSAITPELRETLVAKKRGVLAALALETRILRMPLDRFEREGRSIEVRVPWLPETLWFVAGRAQLNSLISRGVSRGRIWTARELALVWSIPKIDKKQIADIGRVKAELGAEIVSLEQPGGIAMRWAESA